VLRWHVEHGLVAIPKSGNPRRIRENLAAIEFELSPDEVGRLDALDRARRLGGDPDVTDER
jgi:2,5-diketo-D-gluconate reductase A